MLKLHPREWRGKGQDCRIQVKQQNALLSVLHVVECLVGHNIVRQFVQPPIIYRWRRCQRVGTCLPNSNALRRQSRTLHILTLIIHRLLQRVPLPPKDIIRMRPKSSLIALTPHKRLGPILGPNSRIVERRRIPDDLHIYLGQQHREPVGTHAAALDLLIRRRHMAPMVIGVKVHAIPALRKAHVGHDARRTRRRGHRAGPRWPAAQRRQAAKRQRAGARPVRGLARRGVADEHAEPRREGSHRAAVVRVGVVDGHAAGAGFEAGVWGLRDAVVGAVAGAEEERLRPVVGEVVGEGAGGAGGFR